MFVHLTVIYITIDQEKQSVQSMMGGSPVKPALTPAGLRQAILIESLDEPGKIIWLSFWETRTDAQAFLASPDYAGWLAPLRPYIRSGPEWHSYRSLAEEFNSDQKKY